MTPAEELRQAARGIRTDDFVPTEAFFRAVADLLDKIAWMAEMDPDLIERVGGDETLAVARAYLGTGGQG